MAVDTLLADAAPGLVLELGKIGLWVQTVGLIVVVWIVIQIINYVYNRRRMRAIEEFRKDIARIEKKINALSKSKKTR